MRTATDFGNIWVNTQAIHVGTRPAGQNYLLDEEEFWKPADCAKTGR